MEEKTKKRSRKTKLVPREYLDSDDENIAQMQNEIEETIAKMNPLSILRKLEPKKPEKTLDFTVKVEVEEFNDADQLEAFESTTEEKRTETEAPAEVEDVPTNVANKEAVTEVNDDLNIKIQSVQSLSESHTTIISVDVHYKLDDELIRQEFDLVSQETTSTVDKMLEIHIRNAFGRRPAYSPHSDFDHALQKKLKKWRAWYDVCPDIREAPLVYICHICDTGYWHFSEFRDHVAGHSNFTYRIETQGHNFRLSAVHSAPSVDQKKVPRMPDCWKCGRDITTHLRKFYKCKGCEQVQDTCTLLSLHEGSCEEFKEMQSENGVDTSVAYSCPVCPYKYWEEDKVQKHLASRHVVRSDLPIHWTSKQCPKCSISYQDFRVHECPQRPKTEICDYCSKKFQCKPALAVHLSNSKVDASCTICDYKLKRSCMEPEHLLQHTKTYLMLYRCNYLTEPVYFLDYRTINRQRFSNRLFSKKLFFDKVIVPRSILKKVDPILNEPSQTSKITPTAPVNFDNACQGLIGYLDNKKAIREAIYEDKYQQAPNGLLDADLGVQVTIISKNIAQELLNATKADLKAKKICDKFASALERSDHRIRPVSRTYANRRKVKNEADKPLIEVPQIKKEPQDEAGDVEIKQEPMEMDSYLDVDLANVKSEMEVADEVQNVHYDTVDCEFEVKEEAVDEDFEHDIISWTDTISSAADESQDSLRQEIKMEPVDTDEVKRAPRRSILPMKTLTDRYACTKCDTTSSTLRKYLLHFVVHNYKPATCPKCFKQLACPHDLVGHVNLHIKNNFVMMRSIRNSRVKTRSHYQCRKCKKTLGPREFFEHWEGHLEIRHMPAEEQKCVVNMDEKPELKEMLVLLQGPDAAGAAREDWKLRACVLCRKRFERRNDCKRHYIEHLMVDAYGERHRHGCLLCQLCGLGFQKREGYKRHMRDHASLPIYKCEMCDKTFSDSSNFCKHKKVHNLAVMICDICKKKFSNKTYLIRHIKLHQVTKPIGCETCARVFYTQSSYNKHLKRNRSRFKCPVCNVYYTSLKHKWDHMWQVHKERKYEADCPLCDKSFRKFLDVKRHLREQHDDKSYLYYKKTKKIKRESDDVIVVS